MKKKNLLVLICLLLVIALVGCGNKDNVATNKDTETVAKETVDEAVTEEEAEETEETETTEEDAEEEATEEEAMEEEATEESEKAEETEQKAKEEANKNTTKSNTKKTEKSTTEQAAKKTANKETEKQKDTTPTPTPKPDPTPTPKPEPTPTPTPEPKEEEPEQKEVEKKGLLALTPQELKRMLDEEYPGDNIPQWWIDTHSGEKLYEYTWGKYGKEGMMDFYRTAERVIDENTIECDITRTMKDETTYLHKIRLKVDDEGIWTVVSDKIVG